ncbi:MAG: STAS domain-containing protein [Proteobacteria bacterium]|nr:STAS domain-containing protein [Pseudomonadota bacterium]
MSKPRPDIATVDFVGDLTIRGVAAAHAQLRDALANGGAVVRIDPDASVDLTFVQIIESGRRSARETGAGLTLAAPAQGALLETLTRGGFVERPDQRAFWLDQSGES